MSRITKLNKVLSKHILVSTSCGRFTLGSFNSIKTILSKHKKLYKNILYKKIPINNTLYIKKSDIILELVEFIYNYNILKLINSKISFKFIIMHYLYK